MGVSPLVTIDACMEVARRYNKKVMIDLLNTSLEQKQALMKYKEAVLCDHVSKDEQEEVGSRHRGTKTGQLFEDPDIQVAAAGGITLDSIGKLRETLKPAVVIIGSAITKADNPAEAAAKFKQICHQEEEFV